MEKYAMESRSVDRDPPDLVGPLRQNGVSAGRDRRYILFVPNNKKENHSHERFSFLLVDATRFELATSASRTQRSTKLSHASMSLN